MCRAASSRAAMLASICSFVPPPTVTGTLWVTRIANVGGTIIVRPPRPNIGLGSTKLTVQPPSVRAAQISSVESSLIVSASDSGIVGDSDERSDSGASVVTTSS
jgi:hypothetical protein